MEWTHFRHGADIGVRGVGSTPAEAFEQAALALTGVLTDPGDVAPRTAVAVRCDAPDAEQLLYDWLNAIVYEMATRRMLFGRFTVSIDEHRLAGEAWGEPVDRERHRPAVEIKGATYTALAVTRGGDGAWTAQCVVDV
jgi:tRNA nucleotidyltransferase (CCA-adding enzyme)